jgi:enamine deaminase RidA (YjgF/YER057c/UK114 family)
MNDQIRERLAAAGLVLPQVTAARNRYRATVIDDGLLFVSGQTPKQAGVPTVAGRLGAELDVEQGRAAARLAALNLLAQIDREIGLERVKRLLKLNGYVASADGFVSQPAVIDGASEVLVEVLGAVGEHARTSVGVAWLPGNAPVEVELIARVTP